MNEKSLTRRTRFGQLTAFAYVFPALAVYGIFILYPVLNTLRYSFYDWTGFSAPIFIGLNNYQELFQDTIFQKAIVNNFRFILYYTVFSMILALFLTALLIRRNLAGRSFFRSLFFIPYIMPMVAVGVTWRWIYNPAFGLLNETLRAVGLGSLAYPWLGDFSRAFSAIGMVALWVQFGFCLVLFMAGVQNIDESLYDAARVDGANDFQQFFYVTIPGIYPELIVAAVTTLIYALRSFDLVFVTTRGGPGYQTMVTTLYLYQNAFQLNRLGYASSISVVLTLLILLISFALLKVSSDDRK